MAVRKVANYFNFSGGLNTDLGVLNRDPNQFTECKNVIVNKDGSIRRRRGIDFLEPYYDTAPPEASTEYAFLSSTIDRDGFEQRPSFTGVTWSTTFNNEKHYYIVIKEGKGFRFFPADPNKLTQNDTIETLYFFTKSDYWAISKTYLKQNENKLFYADKFIQPGFITADAGGMKAFTLDPEIRSREYHYFRATQDNTNKIPYDNTTLYWENITASIEDTDVDEWDPTKDYKAGDTVKARFFKEKLFKDPNVYNNLDDMRYPGALEFYSGRLWLSASSVEPNKVWYSQVVLNDEDYTKFYQEADPNNLQDPATVADDGGVISITGADEILNIAATQYSLLVLANNGIWEITGADGIFDATNYTVRKVTDYGLMSKDGFAIIEGTLIYVSRSGIYAVGKYSELSVSSSVGSISSMSIDNILNEIPNRNKRISTIDYNPYTKKVYIGLNIDTTDHSDYNYLENANLAKDYFIYDIEQKAWYIWRLKEEDTSDDSIAINTLFQSLSGTVEGRSADVLVAVFRFKDNGNEHIGFGLLEGAEDSLVDFAKVPFLKSYYHSTVSSAHQTYDDIMRAKKPEYLTALFKRTETGTEEFPGKDVRQSSCFLRVSADFAEDPLITTDAYGEPYVSNPSYGKGFEIYPKQINAVSFLGNKSAGYSHTMSQHRVAGRGNVLQFTFSDGDHTRYFKAIVETVTHPLINPEYWEEIEPDDTLPEWENVTTYNSGDKVKVILTYDFHLIGWACSLVGKTNTEA